MRKNITSVPGYMYWYYLRINESENDIKNHINKEIESKVNCMYMYSQLSLSRLRLSRITAFLEEKIWSLFKHRNLTSGNKILWIRGEISPLSHNIFNIYF